MRFVVGVITTLSVLLYSEALEAFSSLMILNAPTKKPTQSNMPHKTKKPWHTISKTSILITKCVKIVTHVTMI